MGKEGDATPFTSVTVDNISAALHRWAGWELRGCWDGWGGLGGRLGGGLRANAAASCHQQQPS